ncbi:MULTISPECIES: hypothetical protein [Xenorhabdus]|uniref:Uncharacterized protein n=1 Tax=Xenorhabdus griffiniae TaxID=351672 RepID=A0ABY9XFH5_9GAMM|nr:MULTISPECIES: hypothetical protein [Xenorhabdus]WMV71629.1 hypothetical protein QL128_16015 [Xenorhabdus griffiniae]WNH01306.1 hypothetical protein QL112_016020 [Xenorhabdus griffiniae]
MSTFTSATIKEPATKQKKAINIKGIVANIAQANSQHIGTTPITFLAGQCPKYNNRNNSMGTKNKDEFKHHLLTSYRVSPKHTEPVPYYNLEPIVDYGYALYKRKGRYMYLVDIIPH